MRLKTNPAVAGGARPEGIETAAGMAYYTAETAKNGGSVVRHYSMILSGGTFSGYVDVQVPRERHQDLQRRCRATDAGVRRPSARKFRSHEQLALMPFKVDRSRRLQERPCPGGDRRPAARRRR